MKRNEIQCKYGKLADGKHHYVIYNETSNRKTRDSILFSCGILNGYAKHLSYRKEELSQLNLEMSYLTV